MNAVILIYKMNDTNLNLSMIFSHTCINKSLQPKYTILDQFALNYMFEFYY